MCTNIIYPPPSFFFALLFIIHTFCIFFYRYDKFSEKWNSILHSLYKKIFRLLPFYLHPPPFRFLRNHTDYARRSYTLYRHDQLKTLIPKQCPYTCETAINCGCGLGFFPPLNRAVKFYSFKRRDVIAIG